MSYRNYPPSRMRGLAYADNIVRRFLNRRRVPISPISRIPSVVSRYGRPINRINIDLYVSMPYERGIDMSYNTLSQLHDVKQGVSLKNLLKYSSIKVNDDFEQGFCVICQDEIKIKDIIRNLKNCCHSFHIECIDEWFSENKKCPICKFDCREIS